MGITFTSLVPAPPYEGYHWADGMLVPVSPENGPPYDVFELKDPTPIFFHFADLTTDDEILAFANKYGSPSPRIRQPHKAGRDNIRIRRSAKTMRQSIEHWQTKQYENVNGILSSLFSSSEHFWTPPLTWIPSVTPGGASLQFQADTLFMAIWLRFFQAAFENSKYKECALPECGRLFDVGDQGKRTDREFCSESHRVTMYLRRRKRAREMRDEGEHLRTIAKEFGVNLKTIKLWLGE